MPEMTVEDVRRLVVEQLAAVADPARRRVMTAHLIEPSSQVRRSVAGDEKVECWAVARSADGEVAIVFAPRGPVPDRWWGIVMDDDDELGSEDGWHASLEQALLNSLCPELGSQGHQAP